MQIQCDAGAPEPRCPRGRRRSRRPAARAQRGDRAGPWSSRRQPFRLPSSSTSMVPTLRNSSTRMARPIADSAAATVRMKKTKIWPEVSSRIVRERDEIEVDREQHQLDRHEHDDHVAPVEEDPDHADREQDRAQHEIVRQRRLRKKRQLATPCFSPAVTAAVEDCCFPVVSVLRRQGSRFSDGMRRMRSLSPGAHPHLLGRILVLALAPLAMRQGDRGDDRDQQQHRRDLQRIGVVGVDLQPQRPRVAEVGGRRRRAPVRCLAPGSRRPAPAPSRPGPGCRPSRRPEYSCGSARACRSKLTSSIMTTNRNSTMTAPT